MKNAWRWIKFIGLAIACLIGLLATLASMGL